MKHLEAITYQVVFPEEGLKDFVSHFWCSRWNTGIQKTFSYHATANTNTELVFAFEPGKQLVFSNLQGHTAHFSCIETGGLSEMFGVSLYSHAIPFFFDASAGELINQLVELRDILQSDVETIAYRLANCNNFGNRVELMSHYLRSRFDPSRKTDIPIINAIRTIRGLKGQVIIDSLAKGSFLSQKQFERRFRNFTGFNPKLYSRIVRFESTLWPYDDDANLAYRALDLGYYDQSHFINDFKQFSGFSPTNYTPVSL